MLDSNAVEMAKELRHLLRSIQGAKNLTETFSLSYVVVVDGDEAKANVEQVADLLSQQAAEKYGIELDIVAATEQEVQEATSRFEQLQSQNASFKYE